MAHSGGSTSVWMATSDVRPQPQLTSDTDADVCIVGAGIAGLTTAYLLAREGKSVVVLDDGPIGGGETGRTTAHLSNALDDRYFEIERLHGADGVRLAAESHTGAISRIEAIVSDENIECDFERLDGYLFAAPGDPLDLLDRELEAAHRAGLLDVIEWNAPPWISTPAGACAFRGKDSFTRSSTSQASPAQSNAMAGESSLSLTQKRSKAGPPRRSRQTRSGSHREST